MSKNMNWGKKIAIFIIIFILANIAFVLFSYFNKLELVTDNYYQKELLFQQEIDKANISKEISDSILVMNIKNGIRLSFPMSVVLKSSEGTISFYKPDNSSKDFRLKLDMDSSYAQTIPLSLLSKGLWRIKIEFIVGENNYLINKSIIL